MGKRLTCTNDRSLSRRSFLIQASIFLPLKQLTKRRVEARSASKAEETLEAGKHMEKAWQVSRPSLMSCFMVPSMSIWKWTFSDCKILMPDLTSDLPRRILP